MCGVVSKYHNSVKGKTRAGRQGRGRSEKEPRPSRTQSTANSYINDNIKLVHCKGQRTWGGGKRSDCVLGRRWADTVAVRAAWRQSR